MLDFAEIMVKCGLTECESPDFALSAVEKLESEYSRDELVEIYNYILQTVKNPVVLMKTIALADKIRDM